jgi:hypothetical protein
MRRDDQRDEMTSARKAERLFTTWVTSEVDGLEHAVTDEEMTAGINGFRSNYEAVCRHAFMPLPMVCPAGPRCARCLMFLRAKRCERPAWHRRPGWFARLCSRRLRHAAAADAGSGSDAPAGLRGRPA